MKTYHHLFEKMIDPEVISRCALDAAEGKLRRKEVIQFFENFDKNYNFVIRCASDPNYDPCENNRHEIIDGANHKQREIEKPRFCPEQVLHHMIIEGFEPVLLKGLYEQVYGCLPPMVMPTKTLSEIKIKKFGPHAAIKQLKKWTQIGSKLYVAETDIHHAYASVHIGTLLRQMERVIKDDKWFALVRKFLHYNLDDPERENVYGLILGHYTSPWFFNFYLKTFDHYVAAIPEVKYLRFADNIYLVGSNKRKVHNALKDMETYLYNELHMGLNDCTQVYRFEYPVKPYTLSHGKKERTSKGRAINALGTVIHYNRTGLRKSILTRMRRKANRINKKGRHTTWHDGASMFSRIAWIRQSNTYKYYAKHIKVKIDTKSLKRRVSDHSKAIAPESIARRKQVNEGLAKSKRLAAAKAKSI